MNPEKKRKIECCSKCGKNIYERGEEFATWDGEEGMCEKCFDKHIDKCIS